MCAQYGNCTRGRRSVPGIRHGVTDIRHVATGICRDPTSIHKDSTHDAMRHGCYLYCHARVLHVFLLFPLDGYSFAAPSFQLHPVFGARSECRQMTPRRVSSASGTKAGTTLKTFFKLRALSFCFCPKGRGGTPLQAQYRRKRPF